MKLKIPARTLGLPYAIIGLAGGLFALSAMLGLLGLGPFGSAVAAISGYPFLRVIGTTIAALGLFTLALGGYRMRREGRRGKTITVSGLVAAGTGGLISALGGGAGGLAGAPFNVAIVGLLCYLVIVSRSADDPRSSEDARP